MASWIRGHVAVHDTFRERDRRSLEQLLHAQLQLPEKRARHDGRAAGQWFVHDRIVHGCRGLLASDDVQDEEATQTGEDSGSSGRPTNSCQGNVMRQLRGVLARELGRKRCPTPVPLVNFFTREKKTEQSARQAAGHVHTKAHKGQS